MNPPSFTGSSTTEDLENFVEDLKKVFEVMHVVDVDRVELAVYQLKSVARTWFDKWKGGKTEVNHVQVGLILKKPSWKCSFLAN